MFERLIILVLFFQIVILTFYLPILLFSLCPIFQLFYSEFVGKPISK